MIIVQDSLKPIYVQIAEGIEDDIMNGVLHEDDQAYSQYVIARQFNINPATAAKGINLLYEEGILYKKRGLGMYVAIGAKQIVREKRKAKFFATVLKEFLAEAKKLEISTAELKKMIDKSEGVPGDETSGANASNSDATDCHTKSDETVWPENSPRQPHFNLRGQQNYRSRRP